MKLVVLSSIVPSIHHTRAGRVVLGAILEELHNDGHDVTCIIDTPSGEFCENDPSESFGRIQFLAVRSARQQGRLRRGVLGLLGALSPRISPLPAGIEGADSVTEYIRNLRPDGIILFWDTRFECLIPRLAKNFVVGLYGARPPYMARMARNSNCRNPLLRSYRGIVLRAEERKHLNRMKLVTFMTNISLIDQHYYENAGIACGYIPNTWPSTSRDLSSAVSVDVAASIGDLGATGNLMGFQYLLNDVLTSLTPEESERWKFHIFGAGNLPEAVGALGEDSRITLRGFVEDFEGELQSCLALMVLNSTGNYEGAYTRVIVALSLGVCLIVTPELCQSMPELEPEENCLVADSGREAIDSLERLLTNAELRRTLRVNGHKTYNERYSPKAVVTQITDRISMLSLCRARVVEMDYDE